mgnify:CR=1 FL=1
MKKFLTKSDFLAKKELANRAKELANFEQNIAQHCSSKKNNKTSLNYNSPNVRERMGFCKTY